MLRRLIRSRWVKVGFFAIALGLCVYGVVSERGAVTQDLRHLTWESVLGAFAAAMAGMFCMMLSWRALLRDLGSPLPIRGAVRVMFISNLAKYVPGSVWVAAAQVELGRAHQIPRKSSATAAVFNLLVSLATGLVVAAVALSVSSRDAAGRYWWALATAPFALLALYPPVSGFLVDLALRLAKRPSMERRIGGAGLSRAVGWSLLGWGFYSVHAWLLVADVAGKSLGALPIAAGAYALAWSVGFIAVPFPAGVGPREAALIAALAPVMSAVPAGVVALVSRIVLTFADLGWAGVAFALGRAGSRSGGDGGRRRDGAGPETAIGAAASPVAE